MLDLKNAGLTELLNDFYTLTDLKLCVFDTDYEECRCSTDVMPG